jgi:hypothetical protein
MPFSTRHELCKERRTVLEQSASGDPNLAGDVGVLSLLVRQGGDASLCDFVVVQFGHTLDFFRFLLDCEKHALVFRLTSARANGAARASSRVKQCRITNTSLQKNLAHHDDLN